MRFIKRAALGAALTLACAGAGASPARAESGCVGLPQPGGLLYHCFTVNADDALPRVATQGSTTVDTTIPAVCYFLDCVDPTPVRHTVPLRPTVTRPTSSVVVFQWENSCRESGGTRQCASRSGIWYDAWLGSCQFYSDDPAFRPINGLRVACQL